jgi:CRISPR/Cas system type I-B associated protein Csh2 (Cas7 group RAMP superfamily)
MGSKHLVPVGLYKGTGHVGAPLAQKTGVTSTDLEIFWLPSEGWAHLVQAYPHSRRAEQARHQEREGDRPPAR